MVHLAAKAAGGVSLEPSLCQRSCQVPAAGVHLQIRRGVHHLFRHKHLHPGSSSFQARCSGNNPFDRQLHPQPKHHMLECNTAPFSKSLSSARASPPDAIAHNSAPSVMLATVLSSTGKLAADLAALQADVAEVQALPLQRPPQLLQAGKTARLAAGVRLDRWVREAAQLPAWPASTAGRGCGRAQHGRHELRNRLKLYTVTFASCLMCW